MCVRAAGQIEQLMAPPPLRLVLVRTHVPRLPLQSTGVVRQPPHPTSAATLCRGMQSQPENGRGELPVQAQTRSQEPPLPPPPAE
ncbi:unnamed protein product [Mesocestoides corti]|uniref:Uncharacterized protein n=1 Tax=Mesocestoides corti TaxID=53468 RepID=A0A0R3UAC5_MESCO|nr:unnamed protein product [Mesocestoides corti]